MDPNMNNSAYSLGGKIKNVTPLPNFLLQLQGRWDARRNEGEAVARAHLDRYYEKCASIESAECLATEKYLKSARKDGAAALAAINKNRASISSLPEAVKEEHLWDVKINRDRRAALSSAVNDLESAREHLYDVNETIINGNCILEERVTKIRKKAAAKMEAYVKGLRAGGLTGFAPDTEFLTVAMDKYYSKHSRLDKAIEANAVFPTEEEVM